MKVWRYALVDDEGTAIVPLPGDEQAHEVHADMEPGATIIGVGFTSNGTTVYALVEGTGVTERREFVVAANGAELPEGVGEYGFRGTAKMLGGPTAHVFDAVPVPAEA
jgi:hypothetical protein